jgi:AcrR family transcriptional regulator
MNARAKPIASRVEPANSSQGEQTKRRALNAAFEVLAESGFEGLRTRAIAAKGQLNHASVHYHFATKERLVLALVDEVVARFQAMHSSVEPAQRSPIHLLRAHVQLILRKLKQEPAFFAALNELRVRARRDPEVERLFRRADEAWQSYLEQIVRASRGQLGDQTPQVVMAFLRGLSLERDTRARERASAAFFPLLTNHPLKEEA